MSHESPRLPETPPSGALTVAAPPTLPARSTAQIARVAQRGAPLARRTLQAVALTLAAEQALRAAGGLALAVVSATRAPELPVPQAPPATRPLARRRLRTVVTEVTIVERRARR